MHQNYIKYNTKTASKSTPSFTGKERDSETGFSYFGARYYDSDILTGWLSVDPLADKYPSLSPYAYCAWNPVRLTDPDGEDPLFFGLLQYQGKAKFGNSNVGDAQKIGNFHVVPFYDNNNNLIGYNAGRYRSDGSYETEYQMETNDIDVFSENNQLYEFAANLAYCAGEPDWSYVACGNNIASGNIEGALSEIGKMWTTSLSDPSFYIATTLSILSLDNSSAVRQVMRNIKSIESNGGNVKLNTLAKNQQLNMTINSGNKKINLRIESYPLSKQYGGDRITPQLHMNVDYYENGVKINNMSKHIILE